MSSIRPFLRRLGMVVTLAAAGTSVAAQAPNSRSAPFLTRVDAEIPGLLEKYAEPGIAVAFIDGCKASIRTYGVANRGRGTPVRADTVFNLGSISKTFTAWTVMTLVEAGRIDRKSTRLNSSHSQISYAVF